MTNFPFVDLLFSVAFPQSDALCCRFRDFQDAAFVAKILVLVDVHLHEAVIARDRLEQVSLFGREIAKSPPC